MMNYVYENIFSQEECNTISDAMLSLYRDNQLIVDDQEYTRGSLGTFNLPATLDFQERIEELIKRDYSSNVKFQNTYTRIYQNGNQLKVHTDRPWLDVTVSICLFSNINNDWTLNVSTTAAEDPWLEITDPDTYKANFQTYSTPVGSGVACLGSKYPHWRDPLVCNLGQYVIQTFYHWSIIEE